MHRRACEPVLAQVLQGRRASERTSRLRSHATMIQSAKALEFTHDPRKPESLTVPVIWMTTGLSRDGDSVARIAATYASIGSIRAAWPGISGGEPVIGAVRAFMADVRTRGARSTKGLHS